MLTSIAEWIKATFIASDTAASQHAMHLAAAALLIEIARADQHISEVERDAMVSALKTTLNLSPVEAQELLQLADPAVEQAVSLTDFTRLLNEHFSVHHRIALIEALWRVAWADADIDKYEEYYIRKIADLLYIPHNEYIRAKLRVIAI